MSDIASGGHTARSRTGATGGDPVRRPLSATTGILSGVGELLGTMRATRWLVRLLRQA